MGLAFRSVGGAVGAELLSSCGLVQQYEQVELAELIRDPKAHRNQLVEITGYPGLISSKIADKCTYLETNERPIYQTQLVSGQFYNLYPSKSASLAVPIPIYFSPEDEDCNLDDRKSQLIKLQGQKLVTLRGIVRWTQENFWVEVPLVFLADC